MHFSRLLIVLVGAMTLVTSTATAAGNATRSLRSETSQVCFRGYMDYDLPGNDIGSAYAERVMDCQKLCLARSDCYAYTQVLADNKCYFKSSPRGNRPATRLAFDVAHATATYKLDVTSGVKLYTKGTGECPKYAFVLGNCDSPAFDTDNYRGSNYESCFYRLTDKSYAFTWSDYNGGTCWMKELFGGCTATGNKYTAFLLPEWSST